MEKFFLSTFLTNNKLNIIDQKYIIISVLFPEFRGGNVVFISNCIDQLIGKFLRSNI